MILAYKYYFYKIVYTSILLYYVFIKIKNIWAIGHFERSSNGKIQIGLAQANLKDTGPSIPSSSSFILYLMGKA